MKKPHLLSNKLFFAQTITFETFEIKQKTKRCKFIITITDFFK